MGDQPTLLLCVGATKAGTSWVQDYLRGHPDCYLRSVKELHYFDHYDTPGGWHLTHTEAQIAANQAAMKDVKATQAMDLAVETADLIQHRDLLRAPYDTVAYRHFLCDGRDDQPVVADVTPAYGLLTQGRLREMARLLPDVRFLYIMRDPVARLWSHVRMLATQRDAEGRSAQEFAGHILQNVLWGFETEVTKRSNYRGVLKRLAKAVDPSRVLIVFYEDLLTAPGIAQLCVFLGITPKPADLSKRVHEGLPMDMTPDQRRSAREWLRPQYEFVEHTMGRLPKAWLPALSEV